MGRKLLHFLNGLITCAVVAALAMAGAYAGYALWDNQQIYDAAENVYSEMKEIKASLGISTTRSAIEELLEENRKAREDRAAEAALATAATETPAVTDEPAAAEMPESAERQTITKETNTENVPEAVQAPLVTEKPAAAGEVTVTNTPAAETAADGETTAATDEAAKTAETMSAPVLTAVQMPEVVPATASGPTAAPAPTAASTAAATAAPTAMPAPTEEPDDSLLGQLRAINKDITAWITLPGTAIDYPVMQGSSNYSYINTDVYGNFALAGSIFLDYRNSGEYTDLYSLLYGHNMSQHRMFSDINLFKEEAFFNEHNLGMLYTTDGWHIIESLAVIVTPASNSGLMNPENWDNLSGEEIYQMAQEDALFTCEEGLEALRGQIEAGETPRLISLSTCSDEFTDARTILLTLMDP